MGQALADGEYLEAAQANKEIMVALFLLRRREEDGHHVGSLIYMMPLPPSDGLFAYVADVLILDSYRGQGLGTWLMETVRAHPDLQGLRRWVLSTKDAHALYQKVGFTALHFPERYMEILVFDIYLKEQKPS